MLSTIQADLHRAVENVIKELNCSYNRYKKAEEEAKEARGEAFDLNASNECLMSINDNLKDTNSQLLEHIKELQARCKALQAELDKARSETFSTFKVHLSGETVKIAELNKEVADLQKENKELCEKLKNKSILDSVLAQKYEKQQIAFNSAIGEAFECELDGKPFEKGYYLRISKKEYELAKSDRLLTRIVFVKHRDK